MLVDAIRFVPIPIPCPALEEFAGAACGLVVVSNWDFSLPAVLERCGLGH